MRLLAFLKKRILVNTCFLGSALCDVTGEATETSEILVSTPSGSPPLSIFFFFLQEALNRGLNMLRRDFLWRIASHKGEKGRICVCRVLDISECRAGLRCESCVVVFVEAKTMLDFLSEL